MYISFTANTLHWITKYLMEMDDFKVGINVDKKNKANKFSRTPVRVSLHIHISIFTWWMSYWFTWSIHMPHWDTGDAHTHNLLNSLGPSCRQYIQYNIYINVCKRMHLKACNIHKCINVLGEYVCRSISISCFSAAFGHPEFLNTHVSFPVQVNTWIRYNRP